MAKAKLASVTERWINDKPERQLSAKEQNPFSGVPKTKQTIYIPKEIVKLLWHNRAETGEPISHAVARLVVENFGKNRETSTQTELVQKA